MTLGVLSYGSAAAMFALLTVLLAASWRGQAHGPRLIAAAAASAVWGAVLAVDAQSGALPAIVVYLAEITRSGAWLAVLTSVGRNALPRYFAGITHAAWFALLAAGVIASVTAGFDATLRLLSWSGLVTSVMAFVLLEQLYRNADEKVRPQLRYFTVGLGGVFACDLLMYSQAELFQGINVYAWHARGIIDAMLVPVIAIGLKRNPQWSFEIFVSRHVVFHTTTFVVIGIYLVVMAAVGYYLRVVGGAWGGVAQVAFSAGAVALLVVLVFSGSLRRRLRVFISKHFYRNKYDYRAEWLRFISTLSSSAEPDIRHTAIRAVAQIFSSPGGVLFTLADSGRSLVPVAAWPLGPDSLIGIGELELDHDLMKFIADRRWIVDLEEYRRKPELYVNVALPAWVEANERIRILSPLIELGSVVGVFALYSPPAPFELTYEDRDLLKTVGQHVATQIAQFEADRKLAENRQFEAYNKLTAFMMHDLKNSVAQLKLLVANAHKHKRNPEFVDDAISTIGNTVERMTGLIEQLRGSGPDMSMKPVILGDLIDMAVKHCGSRQPVPSFTRSGRDIRVLADPARLASIIEHIIRNAQDASRPDDGAIEITLRGGEASAEIVVADNGCGMEAQFVRERLFRPFDSTKGAKGMGIGAYQAREYVRMLGGGVEVQSSPGTGTRFSITLPVYTANYSGEPQAAIAGQ